MGFPIVRSDDAWRGDPPRAGDFTQLALWTAANLAGMITGVLLARGPFFHALAGRVGKGRHSSARPSPRRSLSLLAEAVLGSSRQTVESVFGPPRSTGVPDIGVVVHPRKIFRITDVWYYPLPRNGPHAMAVHFRDDLAVRVEFFTAP